MNSFSKLTAQERRVEMGAGQSKFSFIQITLYKTLLMIKLSKDRSLWKILTLQ